LFRELSKEETMMYHEALTACIKINGNILREHGETVYLPFGSEFSVYLKNLDTQRMMLIDVLIDGKSTTDNQKLVLTPSQSIDLERFIKNGNLTQGNRFKFIERNATVEAHRGVGAEDGLVQIKFQKEQRIYNTYNPYRSFGAYQTGVSNQLYNSSSSDNPDQAYTSSGSRGVLRSHSVPQNTAGITAPGSVSNQQFAVAGWFPAEPQEHSIIFRLLGDVGQVPVTAPLMIKTKLKCPTCGTVNKSSHRFCSGCSAAVTIV
jgi:hypothetical protein